jgi:hypothetical protein
MAEKPFRVLYRYMYGLPTRQASAEDRAKMRPLTEQLLRKWKTSGVKLIGYFSTYGNAVDGFCHHMILELDDLEKVTQMAEDIQGGEFGKLIERFDFHVGGGAAAEEFWGSL